MKQPRIKGQALALVLIVVVISVIIAFAITNRVVQDIKQQGEERASTRAETISESAVENITLQLQNGELSPTASTNNFQIFAISNEAPASSSYTTLGLCDPNSTNVETQCDSNSLVQIGYYKMIIQFKLFDSENLEVFMVKPEVVGGVTPVASEAIIHLKTNESYKNEESKLLIKGFERKAGGLQVAGECLIEFDAAPGPYPTAAQNKTCLPYTMVVKRLASCPTVVIDANLADTNTIGKDSSLGENCFSVKALAGTNISSYRIKPLLSASVATVVPYVDVSVTASDAANAKEELPEYQMAMINAGVYSGTTASDQQVFQQTTRLVLLNKSVPEVADYVLYNGSTDKIVKSK